MSKNIITHSNLIIIHISLICSTNRREEFAISCQLGFLHLFAVQEIQALEVSTNYQRLLQKMGL